MRERERERERKREEELRATITILTNLVPFGFLFPFPLSFHNEGRNDSGRPSADFSRSGRWKRELEMFYLPCLVIQLKCNELDFDICERRTVYSSINFIPYVSTIFAIFLSSGDRGIVVRSSRNLYFHVAAIDFHDQVDSIPLIIMSRYLARR